jgi:hypothetical protein
MDRWRFGSLPCSLPLVGQKLITAGPQDLLYDLRSTEAADFDHPVTGAFGNDFGEDTR